MKSLTSLLRCGVLTLVAMLTPQLQSWAQESSALTQNWKTTLTHVSAAKRAGLGQAVACASTALIPLDANARLDFDRQRFAIYSSAGRRLGAAWTRSLSRKADGSTLVGLAYLEPLQLANFPHAVHEMELRLEEGEAESPPALDARLLGLLEQREEARFVIEAVDPAGNLYRAALPPLAELAQRMERLEWECCVTLFPAEIIDPEAALPDLGDAWFNLRVLPSGDEFRSAARITVGWLNGRLEQRSYRDVYARKLYLRVETPERWAHLSLAAPWWRGQSGAEVQRDRGYEIALYAPRGSSALKLAHGACFAQSLLLHDGAQASAAQTRADFEEFWCALDPYRSKDALLPVPQTTVSPTTLRALEQRYEELQSQWKPKGKEAALIDPFTAQLSFGVPLVRYEPTTGYQGLSTNSRFAVATAMTASPYAALLNRLHTWSALTFPITAYHVEERRLVFDDPRRHVEGEGKSARMPFSFLYLPPPPDSPQGNGPAGQRFGRSVSKQERVLLDLMKTWTLHPEARGAEDTVDLPHHMRSSVYGLQGNLVQACPEYAVYAGAHGSAFAHMLHPWSDGVVAGQWGRANKLKAESGEMPGWAYEETRSNANHFLHAAWALAADTRGADQTAQTLRDCVAAYIDCVHGIRHPRGFNFCQVGKHTLYPATDGTQVELVPILVGTYQLGWVDNCARQLLRVLRARGEEELVTKLNELLTECVEMVLAHRAMIDAESGAMAFYAMGGFANYDEPVSWSLEVGERTYQVGQKTVIYDFSKGRGYSDRFEHHFAAYVQLAAELEREAPERARHLNDLAEKALRERFREPDRTARQLAEAELFPWDLPAATQVLQRR